MGPPALEVGVEGPPQIPQAGKSTGRLGGPGEWGVGTLFTLWLRGEEAAADGGALVDPALRPSP